MQEVVIGLQFITPCLGNIRCDDIDRFERDSKGMVIFMSSWWREVLRYGSQALGRHQSMVKRVRMHARIAGAVKQYLRYYTSSQAKTHEAFLPNDTIVVKAMLPTGMSCEDFQEILRLSGEYIGISPYGWKEGYGQFKVLEVSPVSAKPTGDKRTDPTT